MFYFTCNESRINESLTFLNNLQKKKKLFHDILEHQWDLGKYDKADDGNYNKGFCRLFWIVEEMLGELCEVSRCLLWRGLMTLFFMDMYYMLLHYYSYYEYIINIIYNNINSLWELYFRVVFLISDCSLDISTEIMRSNGFCLANTETIVFDESIPLDKERPSSTDSAQHS